MTDTVSTPRTGGAQGYLRIATEEAFATADMIALYKAQMESPDCDPGVRSLLSFYFANESPRASFVRERLLDIGEQRIAAMDERGIDKQVIGLTAPGPNMLTTDQAIALAEDANDRLGEACARYADRFIGLAACAAQDPEAAAREVERSVARYAFKGVIMNSHVQGEYLDMPKFRPLLATIEALGIPMYLHPQTPPRAMIGPFLEAGLDGAIFGFGVETGFHAMRLITSGTLDRFPNLRVIIGHMGEALPYWMSRLDFMHNAQVSSNRYEMLKPIAKKPSGYLRENFYVTNSGMAWEPAIRFAQQVLGMDRVLYAMDYPYQCPVEEVIALDAMQISADDKKRFFQTNAETAFKL